MAGKAKKISLAKRTRSIDIRDSRAYPAVRLPGDLYILELNI